MTADFFFCVDLFVFVNFFYPISSRYFFKIIGNCKWDTFPGMFTVRHSLIAFLVEFSKLVGCEAVFFSQHQNSKLSTSCLGTFSFVQRYFSWFKSYPACTKSFAMSRCWACRAHLKGFILFNSFFTETKPAVFVSTEKRSSSFTLSKWPSFVATSRGVHCELSENENERLNYVWSSPCLQSTYNHRTFFQKLWQKTETETKKEKTCKEEMIVAFCLSLLDRHLPPKEVGQEEDSLSLQPSSELSLSNALHSCAPQCDWGRFLFCNAWEKNIRRFLSSEDVNLPTALWWTSLSPPMKKTNVFLGYLSCHFSFSATEPAQQLQLLCTWTCTGKAVSFSTHCEGKEPNTFTWWIDEYNPVLPHKCTNGSPSHW